MENTSTHIKKKWVKAILIINMAQIFVMAILFGRQSNYFIIWKALTLYFIQTGLYLLFFKLALWGLRAEQITLPINARRISEAVIFTLVSWLFLLAGDPGLRGDPATGRVSSFEGFSGLENRCKYP